MIILLLLSLFSYAPSVSSSNITIINHARADYIRELSINLIKTLFELQVQLEKVRISTNIDFHTDFDKSAIFAALYEHLSYINEVSARLEILIDELQQMPTHKVANALERSASILHLLPMGTMLSNVLRVASDQHERYDEQRAIKTDQSELALDLNYITTASEESRQAILQMRKQVLDMGHKLKVLSLDPNNDNVQLLTEHMSTLEQFSNTLLEAIVLLNKVDLMTQRLYLSACHVHVQIADQHTCNMYAMQK